MCMCVHIKYYKSNLIRVAIFLFMNASASLSQASQQRNYGKFLHPFLADIICFYQTPTAVNRPPYHNFLKYNNMNILLNGLQLQAAN